jgi:hypothetical protein
LKKKILKLTAFIKPDGIGEEKKSFLLKKTDPTFYTPFLFIKYSKNNTLKASYTCHHSECEKNRAYFQ